MKVIKNSGEDILGKAITAAHALALDERKKLSKRAPSNNIKDATVDQFVGILGLYLSRDDYVCERGKVIDDMPEQASDYQKDFNFEINEWCILLSYQQDNITPENQKIVRKVLAKIDAYLTPLLNEQLNEILTRKSCLSSVCSFFSCCFKKRDGEKEEGIKTSLLRNDQVK